MVVDFHEDYMTLEVRPGISLRKDDGQSQLFNLLITCFSVFEHFAYEIHEFFCLIYLLDKY